MDNLIEQRKAYKKSEEIVIKSFSDFVVSKFPDCLSDGDINLSPSYPMCDANVFNISVSIWHWDNSNDVILRCQVCNSLDMTLSDEEMIAAMKQSKINVNKRIEIALFILESLKTLEKGN